MPDARPRPEPAAAATDRFAAFMSYSHALDGELAPALQSGIEQFGRRWYRRRAVRIFRDSTNLAATPHLWESIERALQGSEWFVLLASPESASSGWVRREVDWWLTQRSPDRLLVALTAGSIGWDKATGRVDERHTDALPPAFTERGLPEPLWVDLSRLRSTEPTDPAFQAAVVDIASTIRGIPKDDLVGEQVAQHRRRRRSIALAAVTLVVMTLLSTVTAVVAVQQRNRAEQQTTIATARQLAGAAETTATNRVDLARLLAASAYRLQPDARSRSALLTATTASPQLERFVAVDSPITALAVSADGDEFAYGTGDGGIGVAGETGDVVFRTTAPQPTSLIALDAGGRHLIAGNEHELRLWDRADPAAAPRSIPSSGATASVALSASGDRIALLGYTDSWASSQSRITFLDGDLRSLASAEIGVPVRRASFPGEDPARHVVFDTADTVHIAVKTCNHLVVRTDASVVSTRPISCPIPANSYISATSASAVAGAFFKAGEAYVFTDTDPDIGKVFSLPFADGELLAVNSTLDRVAVVRSGAVTVATQDGSLSMTGASGMTHIEFLRGDRLVVAAEGGAVVFNTDGVSAIAHRTMVRTDDKWGFITRPEIRISPNGSYAAVVSEDPLLTLLDLRNGTSPQTMAVADLGLPVTAAWTPDGSTLTAVGDHGRTRSWRVDGATVRNGSELPAATPDRSVEQLDAAEYTADGALRLRGVSGDVAERRPDGTAELLVPQLPDHILSGLSPGGRHLVRTTFNTLEITAIDQDRTTARIDLATPLVGLTYPDPDHVLIALADGRTTLITLADGSTTRTSSVDAGNFNSVTAAGPVTATLSLDGRLSLTDLSSGQSLGRFDIRAGAPVEAWDPPSTSIALSPDATRLVTATSGGGVLVWSLDPATQVEIACRTAGHDLTPQDWAALVGTDPPADLRCQG